MSGEKVILDHEIWFSAVFQREYIDVKLLLSLVLSNGLGGSKHNNLNFEGFTGV